MPSRRFASACAAGLMVGLIGCGKKDTTSAPDSPPPQYPGPTGPPPGMPGVTGPAPLTNGTKGKPDDAKPDFDILLSEMKLTAGKPKTDVRPSGSMVLSRFTTEFPPSHERRAEAYKAFVEVASQPEL